MDDEWEMSERMRIAHEEAASLFAKIQPSAWKMLDAYTGRTLLFNKLLSVLNEGIEFKKANLRTPPHQLANLLTEMIFEKRRNASKAYSYNSADLVKKSL